MNESKPWYESKTLWGITLAAVGVVLGATLSEEVGTALTLFGLGVAGLGRVKAEATLTKGK